MTRPKNPEARWLTEDYPVVILHAHLFKDEAMQLKLIGEVKDAA